MKACTRTILMGIMVLITGFAFTPNVSAQAEAVAAPADPAAVIAELPAPPDSQAVSMADLPESAVSILKTMLHVGDSDPVFTSTATAGVIHQFYHDELTKRGYMGRLQLDEQGKPISPYFSYFCDKGVIRVIAAEGEIPEKTVVALTTVSNRL